MGLVVSQCSECLQWLYTDRWFWKVYSTGSSVSMTTTTAWKLKKTLQPIREKVIYWKISVSRWIQRPWTSTEFSSIIRKQKESGLSSQPEKPWRMKLEKERTPRYHGNAEGLFKKAEASDLESINQNHRQIFIFAVLLWISVQERVSCSSLRDTRFGKAHVVFSLELRFHLHMNANRQKKSSPDAMTSHTDSLGDPWWKCMKSQSNRETCNMSNTVVSNQPSKPESNVFSFKWTVSC